MMYETSEVRCPWCHAEPGEPCYPDTYPDSEADCRRLIHLGRRVVEIAVADGRQLDADGYLVPLAGGLTK